MIVPVPTRQKGLDALPGLKVALASYKKVLPKLDVALYVPTFYDARRLHDREVLADLRAKLAPWLSLCPSGKRCGWTPPCRAHRWACTRRAVPCTAMCSA
ncbi:ParA family protein [Deinococcus multiflagellatus]|uniref:ParA family protein n=2 Tax=Deinococcus multiflagellatus TaxID=1656887 RepID=A0ABW1ZQ93_9DEIO